jgi:hypothetical protein
MTSGWADELADQITEAAEALLEMDLTTSEEVLVLTSAAEVVRRASATLALEESRVGAQTPAYL